MKQERTAQLTGIQWAQQFKADPFRSYRQTQDGNPMMPSIGGYGPTPNMPYMTAPHGMIRPAGIGPIEMGIEGFNRAFALAHAANGAGRNPYGDVGRQGRKYRVVAVGVQGFDATALRVK